MNTTLGHRQIGWRLRVPFNMGGLVAALLIMCSHSFCIFGERGAIPVKPASAVLPDFTRGEFVIPGVSLWEKGFNVDKMWEIFFKSPTATQAEENARAANGGRSPFWGKTRLKFPCFYPHTGKILIPADYSETRAALAYAYELKHFENREVLLELYRTLRQGAISVAAFVDRCVELEAQAALQEVKVARELRKAWVLDAHSPWEIYCERNVDSPENVTRIIAGMDSSGHVPGTDKTVRGYYMWLASQQLKGGAQDRFEMQGQVASAHLPR